MGPKPSPASLKYVVQAEELLVKIQAEDALIAKLRAAVGGGDAAALAAALEEAEGRPSGKARLEPAKGGVGPNKATALAVEAARAAKQQAEAAAALTAKLAAATEARDNSALAAAVAEAEAHEMELAKAAALREGRNSAARRSRSPRPSGGGKGSEPPSPTTPRPTSPPSANNPHLRPAAA